MAGVKSIIGAFTDLGKTRQTISLTKMGKALPSSRENFMYIGLMSHIKYQLIFREIKNPVKGNGQLHDTQVRSQVSTGDRYILYEEMPDLFCQKIKFLKGQLLQVPGSLNF